MVSEDQWDAEADVGFAVLPECAENWPDGSEGQGEDLISLRASCGVGGLLHIIHNAAKGLGSCMQHYDAEIDNMAVLAKFLRERHSKERLISKCFSSGHAAAPPIRSFIESFSSQCYRERWGTVAKCALDLCKVLPALRIGWSSQAYLEGAAQGPNAAESAKAVATVDSLVFNPWFEAYLLMLQAFSNLVMHLLAESCPCHWHIMSGTHAQDLSSHARRVLQDCPLRTRRAPELAANDFMTEVTGFSQQAATDLLRQLPPGLSDADRAAVQDALISPWC